MFSGHNVLACQCIPLTKHWNYKLEHITIATATLSMRLSWCWGDKCVFFFFSKRLTKDMFQYFVTAMIYPCTFLNILLVKIHWERRPAVREHSRQTENTNHGSTSTKDGDSFTFKSTPFTSNSPEILITLRSWPFQTTYCEQKRAITYKIGLHSISISRTSWQYTKIWPGMFRNVPLIRISTCCDKTAAHNLPS